MKQSIYQTRKRELLKGRALKLYREGLSLRQVGVALGRSHQWVAEAVKDLTKVDDGRIMKTEGITKIYEKQKTNQHKTT